MCSLYTQNVSGFKRKRPLMGLGSQSYVILQLLFSNESVTETFLHWVIVKVTESIFFVCNNSILLEE